MPAPDYDTQKDVARANRDFYRAFERLDLDAMRATWADDERIQCIHPGAETLVGPARVHAAWEAIFQSTTWIRFELADVSVQVFGDVAWVNAIERIHSRGDAGPETASEATKEPRPANTLVAEAVATNLFVRRAGADGKSDGWKLLLHHASPLARRILREP
ncbi:MAG: nuclear transport factor 2 family protein [Planctomycetes bacterium]|nr:nuclear transport factor 2 family protein [Planctomycetota bacterium]